MGMTKLKDLIPPELQCSFCPAPFTSLQVNAFGTVGICPKSAGFLQMSADTPMKEKWNSDELEKIRNQFLNGEKPKQCFRCWDEEKAGMKSLRETYLDKDVNATKFNMDFVRAKNYQSGPELMVIQVSNYCNYSCRTCHAVDSSGYNKEGEHYAEKYGEMLNRYRKPGSTNVVGIVDNKHFNELQLKEYSQIKENLKRLEFFGGEPMLNVTHFELLKDIVDKGLAPNITLLYSTNGSKAPTKEHLELWKHFKNIEILLSIDATRQFHNYVRYPGDWEKLKTNANAFKDASSVIGANKLFINSNVTISILNIFNLPEILQDIETNVTHSFPMNLCLNPAYYSIRNLPEEVKPIVIKRLEESKYAKHFHGVINYMKDNKCDEKKLEEFIIWTVRKDMYRKQKFSDVFPEYYEYMKPYFEKYGTSENIKKIVADGVY